MKRGRRPVNQAEGRPIMELPPDLIVVEILSRLPVKTIVRCRCVCKTWRNLLSDPHFAKLHFSRAPVEFLLRSSGRMTLLLAELDEGSCLNNCDVAFRVGRKSLLDFKAYDRCKYLASTIGTRSYPRKEIDICSCDGFLCLFEAPKTYHIYNPITGEEVIVPQMVKDSFRPIGCGFGFSRNTNEFKLLRFLRHEQRDIVEADIQTLGTNSWRSIGVTPWYPRLSASAPFLNGALHWICYSNASIISFDFEEEKFQLFPAPSDIAEKYYLKDCPNMGLGSLGGCLSMHYRHRSRLPTRLILLLKCSTASKNFNSCSSLWLLQNLRGSRSQVREAHAFSQEGSSPIS